MKDEYIIINKIAIQQRIEELEKMSSEQAWGAKIAFKEILSQSTPLIPEIKKAFSIGERYGWDTQKSIGNIDEMREKIKLQSLDNYISNLKLHI